MILTHGKHSFLVGVSWHISQNKADLKEIVSARDGQSLVTFVAHESVWVGFHAAAKQGYAAALAFSAVFPDLILVEHLPDDRFWLCAIHQGMPAPGRDLIMEASEVRGVLLEWMSFFPSAPIYGDVEGAHGSADSAWRRVLDAIDAKEITSKQLRAFRVKKPLTRADAIKILIGASIVASVVAGLYYVLVVASEKDSIAQRLVQEARDAANREVTGRVAARNSKLADMRAQLDLIKRYDSLGAWIGAYKDLPIRYKGYAPKALTCSMETTDKTLKEMMNSSGTLTGGTKPSLLSGSEISNMAASLKRTASSLMGGSAKPEVPESTSYHCISTWQSADAHITSSSRFALDALGALKDVGGSDKKGVMPQSGQIKDFERNVAHKVNPVKLNLPDFQNPVERNIEKIRAAMLDAVRGISGSSVDISIGLTKPISVAGVPEANVPNVVFAHGGGVSLRASGTLGLYDIEWARQVLIKGAREKGVLIQWTGFEVSKAGAADAISATGIYYVPESN